MCVAAGIAGGAIVGGLIQGSAAQSAASTQAGAAENAAQIGQNEFNTITAQESPYMGAGYGALNQLDYLLGVQPPSVPGQGLTGGRGGYEGLAGGYSGIPGGSNFGVLPGIVGAVGHQPTHGTPAQQTSTAGGFGSLLSPFTAQTMQQYSPAYQFQREQGMQGTLNADASGAGALSGAAQKDLIGYNQNMANTAFNNAFNQYQTQQGNVYSRLAGLAQLGQNAAANTGAQGVNLAGNVMGATTAAGSYNAAGQVGAANAYSGAISGAMPWLMAGQGSGMGGGPTYADIYGSGSLDAGPYTPYQG